MRHEMVKGDNNLQGCNRCGNRIPKEVERISFSYSTKWGTNYIRLCGFCVLDLAKQVDKKVITKYKKMNTALDEAKKCLNL